MCPGHLWIHVIETKKDCCQDLCPGHLRNHVIHQKKDCCQDLCPVYLRNHVIEKKDCCQDLCPGYLRMHVIQKKKDCCQDPCPGNLWIDVIQKMKASWLPFLYDILLLVMHGLPGEALRRYVGDDQTAMWGIGVVGQATQAVIVRPT